MDRYAHWTIYVLIAATLIFLLFPLVPFEGNYSLKTALSGSMEPVIKTGAVAFIMPAQKYQVGDIITFKRKGAERTTTHRIYDKTSQDGRTFFITKGDANEDPDPAPILKDQIMGKVYFSIPYLGYAAHNTQTKWGFMALIFIPAVIIISGEVRKIYLGLRELQKK